MSLRVYSCRILGSIHFISRQFVPRMKPTLFVVVALAPSAWAALSPSAVSRGRTRSASWSCGRGGFTPLLVADDTAWRSRLKEDLLGAIAGAEEALGVAEYREERESDRILSLVAEAEMLRRAAEESRQRRALKPWREDEASSDGAEMDEYEWQSVVPTALAREEEKARTRAEREERRAEQRARANQMRTTATDGARAVGSAAVSATLTGLATLAAGLGVGRVPEGKHLPGDGVPSAAREPATRAAAARPPSNGAVALLRRRALRVSDSAKAATARATAWASETRNAAAAQAAAEVQWLVLSKHQTELRLLGLASAHPPKRPLSQTALRKAWRSRSRELHPDVRGRWRGAGPAQIDGAYGEIYALNDAYETLRALI